ncbi:hypothetical protein F7725_007820 [Dissostichus mawsoni]|uniref:Myotubularin phosphatase domain-containing protein n=1 Tax=Dissostichus mawsoni TaxID=36200 RepID=A0A7J5Y7N5_DISMA|nr:hypothetical protein F7725_007820 [Dissostichus mawsoni]
MIGSYILALNTALLTISCVALICALHLITPFLTTTTTLCHVFQTLSCLDSMSELYPFFYRPSNASLRDQWGLSSLERHYNFHEWTNEDHVTHKVYLLSRLLRLNNPVVSKCFMQTKRNPLMLEQFPVTLISFYIKAVTDVHHDRWRLSTVNRDFSVCPSYPQAVIVPKSTDDDMLEKVAKFRQGGRFPVLCYYHKKNGMVIMRSSQPLTGANRKRCTEDEQLLQAVIDGSDKGYIIDTRSSQQALQARMTALQESLIKLVEACGEESNNMDRWLSKLENSKWLSHVQTALSTAGLLAECVERDGHSVLVHGSEGTDSTLLISTLAQLIMDPSCRTLEGFLTLLEREWVQAGHPFQQRCAHSAHSHARLQQESPVFLLLLDCVWQLWRQFPLALGFSEALLLRLATEAYASDYGTFLGNNQQERCALGVKENTLCLFQALLRPRERDCYSNPLYENTELAIWPSVHPQSLQLWRGFFLRWTPQTHHLEEAQEEIRNMVIEWGKLALSSCPAST